MRRPGKAIYLSDIVAGVRGGVQHWKAVAREALKRLRIARRNVDKLVGERDVLAIELWGALRGLSDLKAHYELTGPVCTRCDQARDKTAAAMRRADRVLVRCKTHGPAELELLDKVARAADVLAAEITQHVPPARRSDEVTALAEAIAALKLLRGGAL